MIHPRYLTLAGFILAAAAARLLPHPPNLTPIAAMALFGGAHFSNRGAAFAVPLAAMLLSDVVLGFGPLSRIPFVYGAFALIVGLGLLIRARRTPGFILAAALGSSVLFYLVSNFGAWAADRLYPLTAEGLLASYTAAIPFFTHTVAGDLFYTALLFGGFALAQRSFPALQEGALPATSLG